MLWRMLAASARGRGRWKTQAAGSRKPLRMVEGAQTPARTAGGCYRARRPRGARRRDRGSPPAWSKDGTPPAAGAERVAEAGARCCAQTTA